MVQDVVSAIRNYEKPKDGGSLNSEQKLKNKNIAKQLHAVLDFDGLARTSLGPTWTKLSKKERSTFNTLLRRIFEEVAYPQSSKFFGQLDLEFEDGGLRKKQHVIEVSVFHPDEGLIDLEFFLGKVDQKWKIQDLTLDGISLGRDIQSQIQKIIREESYRRLLDRMRAKLKKEGTSSN